MTATTTEVQLETRVEDALAHLPTSGTTEYYKGQVIFSPQHPPKGIYLVITGKVGMSHISENGTEVLLEIVRPDELFGESAFLGLARPSERATAFEKTTVMAWAISEIQDLVMERPRLAVALLQIVVQRNIECNRRIEISSYETIERRLARSLIRFSERLGAPEEGGSIRMMPFTHEMLARYVGTSRELITTYMNRFRRQGWVQYSRTGIVVNSDPLKRVLDGDGLVPVRQSPGPTTD
jgi:CRP/FNR family transcriptional regulator, cyclic AMP receptor protein